MVSLPVYLRRLGYVTLLGGKTHLKPFSLYPYEYYGYYKDVRAGEEPYQAATTARSEAQLQSVSTDDDEIDIGPEESLASREAGLAVDTGVLAAPDAYKSIPERDGVSHALLQDVIDAKYAENPLNYGNTTPWFIIHNSMDPHGPHTPDSFNASSWVEDFNVSVPTKWPSTKRTRKLMAEYYNDVNKMDRQFKRFLDIMDRNFRDEKAITIFTSDHGGKYFSKWNCYESGLRVPFFLQHRGMEGTIDASIRHRSTLLSFVDILPTFVDMAGGFTLQHAAALSAANPEDPRMSGLDGKSFLNAITSNTR